MKNSQPKPTNARNLEERFEAGEEVLDYFEVSAARVRPNLAPQEETLVVREDSERPPAREAV